MSKFIIAKTTTLSVENFKHGRVYVEMNMPISYSLLDIIQIIKMYSNYGDSYDWSFLNPLEETEQLYLQNDFQKIGKTRFDDFKKNTPSIICNYGPIEIKIGTRGHLKYKKVYPTIYQAVGRFPTEKEFLRNIKIKNIDGKFTVPRQTLPSATHTINDGLVEYSSNLMQYFKNKYKISDETIETFFGLENKLIQK